MEARRLTDFPHCTIMFRDENGNEGTYRYKAEDFDEICLRAEKRLGIVPDPDEPLRYARAKAIVNGGQK